MDVELVLPVVYLVLGLFIGGGGVAVIMGRANASKPLKDSTEKMLYESVPISLLQAGYQVVKIGQQALEFAADVLDGKPNEPAG